MRCVTGIGGGGLITMGEFDHLEIEEILRMLLDRHHTDSKLQRRL
jgi:hypothetical protein